MFFISRSKESNDKTYVDTNMTVNGNTLHFPTIKVKNANIKQLSLNKIISWVELRSLPQRKQLNCQLRKPNFR